MIVYRELRWGNAFSYGPTNSIRLDKDPLTQIVGKNGHGKSSIGLLLEEVQFNTNSKKIKKANILNRYSNSKTYFIELDFDKNNDRFSIISSRNSSSGTVRLMRNGVDISSHTSTGTYKAIENILGYDFISFGQIVYQSSAASLEFLTATDSARKEFLVGLFDLSEYGDAAIVFKKLASDISKLVDLEEGKISVINSWLARNEKEDLTPAVLVEEPEYPSSEVAKLDRFKISLASIDITNKKITQNNTYISILDAIVLDTPSTKPSEALLIEYKVKLQRLQSELKAAKSVAIGASTCPSCKQGIDNSLSKTRYEEAQKTIPTLEEQIKSTQDWITTYNADNSVYLAAQSKLNEWEKYHALVDRTIPTETLDRESLESEISKLEKLISKVTVDIKNAKALNTAAEAKNTKIAVIKQQLVDMRVELKTHSAELIRLSEELAKLQVLVKAFSPTGIVAYKIECLVKDLEELTNKYLSDLADGRFQLSFKIASADKLNVVITDNGQDIEITALSTGERARVNVATLLAIRSLMQGLNNSRTNLLILDETVENLDAEGKEKLIEVLLKEESLNTFLISHGFSHPLLEKVSVVKANNISRIE